MQACQLSPRAVAIVDSGAGPPECRRVRAWRAVSSHILREEGLQVTCNVDANASPEMASCQPFSFGKGSHQSNASRGMWGNLPSQVLKRASQELHIRRVSLDAALIDKALKVSFAMQQL
eukprot:3676342-Amphidinium_carterae.1